MWMGMVILIIFIWKFALDLASYGHKRYIESLQQAIMTKTQYKVET